jgi:hypothetical protein
VQPVQHLLGLGLVAGFIRHVVVRGKDAFIDVYLFVKRGFAPAAATNLLLGVTLFGSLILLPLYYQAVRRSSPLATGLLLAPGRRRGDRDAERRPAHRQARRPPRALPSAARKPPATHPRSRTR